MKRCPQCFFIYPGTDSICDFDQTPLVSVTEAEIAAVTSTEPTLKNSTPSQNRKSWRGFLLSGAIGLLLGMVIVGVYVAVHRQMNPTPSQVQLKAPTSQRLIAPSPSPSATVIVQTATPEPTVEATKSTSENCNRTLLDEHWLCVYQCTECGRSEEWQVSDSVEQWGQGRGR